MYDNESNFATCLYTMNFTIFWNISNIRDGYYAKSLQTFYTLTPVFQYNNFTAIFVT